MGKPKRRMWSMKSDRNPMGLAKTNRLEVIAHQMQRSPAFILKRAAMNGRGKQFRTDGRPIPQWSRLKAGYSDDLGTGGR
jgi:hypothetical protein